MHEARHETRRDLASHGSRPLVVLFAASWLLISVVLLFLVYRHALDTAEHTFSDQVDTVAERLTERLHTNEVLLDGFAALLTAIPRGEWQQASTFARQLLERHPHIYQLEVVLAVPQARLAALERSQRERGHDGFEVRSFDYKDKRDWRRVPDKSIYYPIIFIEPLSPESREVLGLDLDSVPFLRSAMLAAEKAGRAVASRPFDLVQSYRAYTMYLGVGEPLASATGSSPSTRLFASLVIRGEALWPDGLALPGDVVHLRHRGLAADDPEVRIMTLRDATATGRGHELLPELVQTRALSSVSQPFELEVTRQLSWSDLGEGWESVSTLVPLLLLLIPLSLLVARNYYRQRMQRLLAEERLFRLANMDVLTGLPNRHLAYDRMEHAIGRARRERHRLAILFLDLDGFKQVNDRHGHIYGDEILKIAGQRLLAGLRDGDTLARLGGDEFLAVLEDAREQGHAEAVVDKLGIQLSAPLRHRGKEVQIGVSIGVAWFPEDGESPGDLLQVADADMYRVKMSRRDCKDKPSAASALSV